MNNDNDSSEGITRRKLITNTGGLLLASSPVFAPAPATANPALLELAMILLISVDAAKTAWDLGERIYGVFFGKAEEPIRPNSYVLINLYYEGTKAGSHPQLVTNPEKLLSGHPFEGPKIKSRGKAFLEIKSKISVKRQTIFI
jgi:hypothetical protein